MSWSLGGIPLSSVLISRLRYLGDVVMSTVLLEALRLGDPQLDIGYLCETAHGGVLVNHPHLNRLHLLGISRNSADARARFASETSGQGTVSTVLQLRKYNYSAAVDLFFNPRSAWLLRFSGAKIRICGDAGSRRKLFSHAVVRKDFGRLDDLRHHDILNRIAPGGLGEHLCRLAPLHHEPSGLDFVDWLGENFPKGSLRPRISADSLSQRALSALSGKGFAPSEQYLVAAPTATWQTKMMPLRQWQNTLNGLAEATGMKVLVLTAPHNVLQFQELEKGSTADRVRVLEPLGLPDVLGLIQKSKALVSVDGGIMHTGVALGVPTVGLFGPTDPSMWFPYEGLGPFRVMTTRPHCSPCNLHNCNKFICMPELKDKEIVETVQAVMQVGI